MKRIFGTPRALAALLALSLLAGCGAQSGAGAATAETAAPAPTAAPQQLTVYYAGGADSPAATALRAYAAAQGVTLQELYPGEDPAAGLTGVFSLCEDSVTGGGGLPLYTGALLAAGQARDADTLTGPLNGVYSALTLELENAAGAESQAAAAQAVAGGTALFYRGSLAGWRQYTGNALAESLVWLPVKCDLVQSDLGDTEYNLTGLLNSPVLAGEAWLAIPADASEQSRQAAAAAMLWLYTSQAGEETLTQALGLVTPWGTASDDDPLAAMQVEQVGAGILPQPVPDTAQAAALAEAGRALLYTEDGAARESFGSAVRTAWREAAVQALAEPEAADAQAG